MGQRTESGDGRRKQYRESAWEARLRTAGMRIAATQGTPHPKGTANPDTLHSPADTPQSGVLLKADLHVHSRFSTRPSEWILQKLGCAESYTAPKTIYDTALRLGMDLVTITDHNTIDGALEIADLPGAFISEEVTAYFPEDQCKLHVLCYDISEAQHREIQRLRGNVYELVDYFLHESIPHAMAHALYSLNGKLTPGHVERLLLLFRTFELNGSRNEALNDTLRALLDSLDRHSMERMSDQHGILPRMEKPWEKYLIAGSDDHSSLNIARRHTAVSGVREEGRERIRGFLQGITDGRSAPQGDTAQPETMAHNLYSIAYQFYKNRLQLGRHVNRDLLLRFADRSLTAAPEPEGGFITRLHGLMGFRRPKLPFARPPRNVQGLLQKEAEAIIWNDEELRGLVHSLENNGISTEQAWFRFVNHASETVLRNLADSMMGHAMGANLFSVFNTIGAAGSLYTMLAPYFVAYTLFTRDRQFCNQCREHFTPDASRNETLRIGHFTDTYYDVNGVARTLQMQLDFAHKTGRNLTVVTCVPAASSTDEPFAEHEREGVANFEPIGEFSMPEYRNLRLFYPPVLRMLRYAYEQNFTQIHSATPGPVGLVALAIARILQIPIHGTYHTAFPQYVSMLTDDAALEEAMWRYMIWYYNQMDRVYVPSRATGDELVAKGLPASKVVYYRRGVDTGRFHPRFRNGFFSRYGVQPAQFGANPGECLLLYVGRISREKNLHVLSRAFRMATGRYRALRLVVVGDGPYREEMERELAGLPTTFTGYLSGEALAAAYASSSVFVFPSGTDTFGNVVLEAQASGLPVIVTDKGGPKENLITGETGHVVPEGNAAELAGAIVFLASQPELREHMGKAARQYAEGRSFEACFIRQWHMYEGKNAA